MSSGASGSNSTGGSGDPGPDMSVSGPVVFFGYTVVAVLALAFTIRPALRWRTLVAFALPVSGAWFAAVWAAGG